MPAEPGGKAIEGYLGPVLLLIVGATALLIRTGYLPSDSWMNLLALWPMVLVYIGLHLMYGRRSAAASVLVLLLWLVLLGLGAWAVLTSGIIFEPIILR